MASRPAQTLTADPRLPAPAARRIRPLDGAIARRLLAGGLAIGLLADIVLDGPALGLNVPLLAVTVLALGWAVRRRGRAPDPLDAWLPLAAIVLAAFVAVRGDPFLAVLDAAGSAAFLGASLVAMSGLAVSRRSASAVATMAAWTLESGVAGASRAIGAGRPVTDGRLLRVPVRATSLLRGLVLAAPIALIFLILFASADPIFGRWLADIVGWQVDLGSLFGRLLFIVSCAWLATGLLSVAALGIPAVERSSLGAAARTGVGQLPAGRLGAIEALVVLGTIDVVVAVFVGLQLAYLFGGLDTLAAAGMTYSDYARRGFFELVAAVCLAGAVVVALETTVARRTRPYLAGLFALLALTAVVLVSAALRCGCTRMPMAGRSCACTCC